MASYQLEESTNVTNKIRILRQQSHYPPFVTSEQFSSVKPKSRKERFGLAWTNCLAYAPWTSNTKVQIPLSWRAVRDRCDH